MAQYANQDVGRTALDRAQEYLELGYKVIAIVGETGSGKSTLGNLYCGWTENAPFLVENRPVEGTLETTGYADNVNRIYWLDTRGVGDVFGRTQWMALLETLVVHGMILASFPHPRSSFGPQLQELSKYVSTQGFNCLKVFRSDMLPVVNNIAKPHMYEDFLPFNKDTRDPHVFDFIANTLALPQSQTFQVFDVPNLMTRVKELRQALDSAERHNERLQQNNHNLRRDNEHLRAQLQAKQRKLEESTASFDRLSKCFSELQAASWTFTETILRPRSRATNRHTNDKLRFQQRDVNHLFSLFCILSGPIGAALLHEQLASYRRDVREGATALREALFEACPTLSRPSASSGGRLTDVSNGNTTLESRSTVGSRSGLSTSFMEYLSENAVAVVVAAAAAAAAASNPSTPPLSLYSSAQTSPNTSNTQLHTIIDSPSEVSNSSEDNASSGSEDAAWRASDASNDESPLPARNSMVQGPASTAVDHDASPLRTRAASSSAMSPSIPILNLLVQGPTALPSAST